MSGKKQFSGPLTVKHVDLCSHDGPKETVGEIQFELAKSSSRVTATLDFDGSKCTYTGLFSESYHGFMDCGREGSVPLPQRIASRQVELCTLNSAKAGPRAHAQAMAKEYAEDGIRFLDAASREESLISIEAIVNAFAFLYGQPTRG